VPFRTDALTRCAEAVAERVDGVFYLLEVNRARMVPVFEDADWARRAPSVADLAVLSEPLRAGIAERPHIDGLGFIAALGVLADADRHIEWWRRSPDDGRPRRFPIDVDPSSAKGYDYERRPYFTRSQEGHRVVDGPYLDYLATHAVILTFGIPVIVGGRFVGVSAADILMSDVDQVLMPVLRKAGSRVAILNSDRRVVLANSAEPAPGARLKPDPEAEIPICEPDLGWRLRRLDD
jgi:hypothetical protein